MMPDAYPHTNQRLKSSNEYVFLTEDDVIDIGFELPP